MDSHITIKVQPDNAYPRWVALNANQAPGLTHTTNEEYSKVQCVTIKGHWMLKFSTCTELSRKSSIISMAPLPKRYKVDTTPDCPKSKWI